MGPKKTLERIKYSFFWEGLRADVKKFCESCKECQLTRSVRIKDRSSSGACKEPLPAPGNRSNERRYKEKDLARTEEKKVGTGERERAVAKKAGVVKSRDD
ncbi:hypothetical protein TNCV_1279021 [Trichonephila clavipes]|nr:hypothetical protein TNCV_1279021 [Trichonephila clavipes]